MYVGVGHPRCTWDIQTNIQAFQGVNYSKKTYVVHPRCMWDTQDVRGYCKMYVGTVKRTWDTPNILEDSLTSQLYADLALISSHCYAPADNRSPQRGQTNP